MIRLPNDRISKRLLPCPPDNIAPIGVKLACKEMSTNQDIVIPTKKPAMPSKEIWTWWSAITACLIALSCPAALGLEPDRNNHDGKQTPASSQKLATGPINKKSAKASPKATTKVWRLYQDTVQGPANLYIGADAVRLEFSQSQLNMVARGPKWDSIVFSPSSKNRFTLSLAILSTKGEGTGFNTNDFRFINEHNSTRLNKFTADGLVQEGVFAKTKFELKSNVLATFGTFSGSNSQEQKKPKEVRGVQYTYSRSIKLSPGAQSLITSMYKTPNLEGVPLSLILNMANSKQKYMIFRTIKVEKVPVSASFFQEPQGLKPVDNVYKVLGERFRMLEDMGRDLGLGEPFGKE